MSEPRALRVRAVLDTNVIVRGIASARGPSAQILDSFRKGRLDLVTSPLLLDELLDVLLRPAVRSHAAITVSEAVTIVADFRATAHVVGGLYLDIEMVPTDPKDNPVIACALEGDAEYLVTEDRRDLLPLKDHRVPGHRVVHVLKPQAFLRQVLQLNLPL